jgi:hypothetical protein
MKNAVFWDVASCIYYVDRRFGGTYRLHIQGRKIRERGTSFRRWLQTEPPVGNNQLYKNKTGGSVATTCLCWFLTHRFFYPEDGGDTFLRSVGSQKIYTAPHPRRRHFSKRHQTENYARFFYSLFDCFTPPDFCDTECGMKGWWSNSM